MANVSVASGNSVARKSRVVMANAAGQLARVDTVTTAPDEVTVDSLDIATLTGVYASGTPGMLVVIKGQSASDAGKTANITGISGTTLTIDTDLSTALGADDIIAVVPPLMAELNTNGGATLSVTQNKDENLALTEGVQTQNTMLSYDTGGDIPVFATIDSEPVGRILLAGIGAHKVSTSLHSYVPAESNDGSYTENDDLTFYTQDGDGVVREVWLGNMATQTVINVPRRGTATINQSVQGAEVVREIGGTGKEFPSGSGNWDLGNFPCDSNQRLAARGALIELGGTFGNALDKSNVDPYFQEVTVTITRGMTDVAPLGNPARAHPDEDTHQLEITGRRLLEDNTIYDDFYGGTPTPDEQTESRLLLKIVNPADETKYLQFDVPRGVYTVDDVQRQRGQFEEQFTYQAIHTLDADGCVDTSTPLYLAEYENGDTTSYHDAI